jgi:hypothetical protein
MAGEIDPRDRGAGVQGVERSTREPHLAVGPGGDAWIGANPDFQGASRRRTGQALLCRACRCGREQDLAARLRRHHDPGGLSAAFVWPRTVRALLNPPPVVRYLIGGWTSLVTSLSERARALGVTLETAQRVEALPNPPVIVATELADAQRLLEDPTLVWQSGHTVCLDLGLRTRRGDPFVVSDLDEAGWVERFTAPDPSLAPNGEQLIQAQMPIRPDESADAAAARLERLLDRSLPELAERETWRRRQVMKGRTGALDLPGQTWHDRPAIDRGDGVFLAGDMVAKPGLLSEVAWASGVAAAQGALTLARGAPITQSRLKAVSQPSAAATLYPTSRQHPTSRSRMPGSDIELADSDVRDGHLELPLKALELVALLPRFTAPRVGDHDHLVGAEVAKLVLDRGRGAGIADLSSHDDVQRFRPRQRSVEPRPRTLQLAVDV